MLQEIGGLLPQILTFTTGALTSITTTTTPIWWEEVGVALLTRAIQARTTSQPHPMEALVLGQAAVSAAGLTQLLQTDCITNLLLPLVTSIIGHCPGTARL